MKKQHPALAAAACLIMLISGCRAAAKETYNIDSYEVESVSPDYKLVKEEYSDGAVKIAYPRIIQYSDAKKAEKLNKYLMERALSGRKLFEGGIGVTAQISYKDSFHNSKLVSVIYSGEFYVKGAAHPVNVFYTENLGLDGLDELRLTDFYRTDKAFAEYILYKTYDSEPQKSAVQYLKDQGLKAVLDMLSGADKAVDSAVFSYFTPDGIGLSFSVPHAIGDHAEFEFTYEELATFAL